MLYAKCLPREYNYPVLIRIPPSVGPALDHMLRFWNFAGMTSSLRFYHELDPMGEFHGAYTFNQIRFTAGSLLSGRRNLGPHMGWRRIRDYFSNNNLCICFFHYTHLLFHLLAFLSPMSVYSQTTCQLKAPPHPPQRRPGPADGDRFVLCRAHPQPILYSKEGADPPASRRDGFVNPS